MKLLVDMNLSPNWIGFLSEAGFEAEHWSSIGSATASDAEIMAHARAGDYVVFTHDLDFGAILAVTHGEKPSVVQVRSEDVTHAAIGTQVVNALRQLTLELEQGALLTIDSKRTRIRVLPLQLRDR
jgi:predicted nuclease of predicted toxin-antitoxin system